jgi:hypothetical protein
VRWEALFADLAAQRAALEHAELAAEVAERTRGEVGGIAVHDRLRAAIGADVRLALCGGTWLAGKLTQVGRDWLLLSEPGEVLAASGQLLSVRGLDRAAAAPGTTGIVESRIGIRQPLRAVARDRSVVRIHLVDGSVRDGVIHRVGADDVELGVPRQRADRAHDEVVAIAAIAAVRRSV